MDGEEFNRLVALLDKMDERIRALPTGEQFKELKATVVTKDYMEGKYDGLTQRLTWLEKKHGEDMDELMKLLKEERDARLAAEVSRQEKIVWRVTQAAVALTMLTQIVTLAGRVRLLP